MRDSRVILDELARMTDGSNAPQEFRTLETNHALFAMIKFLAQEITRTKREAQQATDARHWASR